MRNVIRVKTTIGMKGFYRVQLRNKHTGKVRIDTGWFPNLLLNEGRNIMATEASWMTWCHVGTDNEAPLATQTALLGFVASTQTVMSDISGSSGSAPHYGYRRKVFRVSDPLIANENLKEVGVGWAGTNDGKLISRALILNPILQTPTIVTPLPGEVLDITYELRYYAPVSDVLGPQVVLDGVTYDTKTRASSVSGGTWYQYIGEKIVYFDDPTYRWLAYDGAIGTVEQGPSGVASSTTGRTMSNSGYSNNSYELEVNCSVGATGFNLVSGIRSIRIVTKAGNYQTEFNSNPGLSTIPKTVDYSMSMHWTIGWTAL